MGTHMTSLNEAMDYAELLSDQQLEGTMAVSMVETRLLTRQEIEKKHHQLLRAPAPDRKEMVELLRAVMVTDFSLLAPNDKVFIRMMARGFLPDSANHFLDYGPDLTRVENEDKSTKALPSR